MSTKAPQNYLFVEVESEYNDEIVTKSGTKLFLSTQQFTRDDEYDSSNFKATMIRRHYGIVVGLPIKLTDEVKIIQIDPGLPAPGAYLSNERIASSNGNADPQASLNIFTYQWKTNADFEMEMQEGDKVYFHHNTVTNDNNVPEIGDKVYKLGYCNAICIIRETRAGITVTEKCLFKTEYSNGDSVSDWETTDIKPFDAKIEIIPIAGHILVEPLWEEGVQDLGNNVRGKVTKSGIISELHDKPEPLRGKVAFVGSAMKGETMELVTGDKIIYLPHADYEVEIEDKKYYVMKYWEIIAKFE